ncbi:MAG TPA: galactokinase family protein [Vicinamibacterales bacterium]|jgi:galactokinase
MTGASLAAALVDRGLDPRQQAAKEALFDRVLRSSGEPDGRNPPSRVWWIPGRLEVFGKHTDYAGGRTLVCALPCGLALAARPRTDGVVRVVDARSGQHVTVRPSVAAPDLSGWRHYVEVVARRFARNFPGSRIAADIVFASDLPRAAGMSSSSALIVGIAAALAGLARLDARREWQENLRDSLDVAGYYACLENGMTFGSLGGDTGVGTHGGSEDHAAILTGIPFTLSAFAFVPPRRLVDVRVPATWQFVLSPSGVTSEKTGAAREKYNRLSEGTRRLHQLWTSAERQTPSLAAALVEGSAARERLDALIDRSQVPGWPADALRARLDHFIREDSRIPSAVDAFDSVDEATLSRLAGESQHDAEVLLGNQIPETSDLVRKARQIGAFAASSFGAGFGGSVWALIDGSAANTFAERWHPQAFVASPGPALAELTSGD